MKECCIDRLRIGILSLLWIISAADFSFKSGVYGGQSKYCHVRRLLIVYRIWVGGETPLVYGKQLVAQARSCTV